MPVITHENYLFIECKQYMSIIKRQTDTYIYLQYTQIIHGKHYYMCIDVTREALCNVCYIIEQKKCLKILPWDRKLAFSRNEKDTCIIN